MQVFAIHGGDVFSTYEEYLEHLKNWKLEKEKLLGWRDWKSRLAEVLGVGFEVYVPSMPNSKNAKYIEWKIWFEKLIQFMENGVILIGHSLGGIFLAKYLSENTVPKKIKATFLIAAPFDSDDGRPIVEFTLPQSLSRLAKQGGTIFLYHSKDDPVVPFTELAKYRAALPDAQAKVFEDRQHFNQEQFPEIISDIKSLS